MNNLSKSKIVRKIAKKLKLPLINVKTFKKLRIQDFNNIPSPPIPPAILFVNENKVVGNSKRLE